MSRCAWSTSLPEEGQKKKRDRGNEVEFKFIPVAVTITKETKQ